MEPNEIDSSLVGVLIEAALSHADGSLITPLQVGMTIGVIWPPTPPPLSAASTSLPLTAAAEGRPDGLTVHFLQGRHFPAVAKV